MNPVRCGRCGGQLFSEPEPDRALVRTVLGWLGCLACGERIAVPTPPTRRRRIRMKPGRAGRKPKKKKEAHA